MKRVIATGKQSFERIISSNCFYVDKTFFIKEWWESEDDVTLITRPRRFGKTLNMEMLETFFSNRYENGEELFEDFSIWKEERYRELQGSYPVIILLDEYDTPMLEAYQKGYWDELASFTRGLFNSTFKTNPYMERGIMTGITRISKESIFSDLNNLEVVTTTSKKYATAFGFTEKEVFAALDEYGLSEEKEEVKKWYDGFHFGGYTDIYNPWSILNFLSKKEYIAYWANTSSNDLVGKLIRKAGGGIKKSFEDLINGKTICCPIDEQLVYNQLDRSESAIWSLLVASGYLKIVSYEKRTEFGLGRRTKYELAITNGEVIDMFAQMVSGWFSEAEDSYNDFIKAMLLNDLDAMNVYMNRISMQTFSSFDTGKNPSESEPERFYHGFVLGLMADLSAEYFITSNRESGFGRYDVMMEPRDKDKKAVIMEFKVHNPRREASLEETVEAAHKQIEEKQYEAVLLDKGFSKEQIYKYGFAFEGKKVLIG